MKIIDVEQGTPEWLDARRGKISGTILGDIYAKRGGRKVGFYQVLAERLGLDPDDENRMDRGLRLEDEAAEIFEKKYAIKTEKAGICVSSFSDEIINSPDRLIRAGAKGAKSKTKYSRAVEIKCLSPARHLQAVIEDEVPKEFDSQKIQYFIVNDDLEILYFAFYDPRIPSVPFHVIEVRREDVKDQIEFFKNYQLEQLAEMKSLTERLAF